jgi:hypothetical protein
MATYGLGPVCNYRGYETNLVSLRTEVVCKRQFILTTKKLTGIANQCFIQRSFLGRCVGSVSYMETQSYLFRPTALFRS